MASAFALSVAKNLPSGSCTLKDGGLGVDFPAFTTLNILRESSVDVISNTSMSALRQARSRSRWLICLKMRHLSAPFCSVSTVTISFNTKSQGTLLG